MTRLGVAVLLVQVLNRGKDYNSVHEVVRSVTYLTAHHVTDSAEHLSKHDVRARG